MLERDALVAEVLAELVDALDAADDAALQVELGRDPQVEVAVERVVVGRERPRQRAAVERLQDRRLDLEEAARVEPLADRGDDLRALAEQLAGLRVGDQVELAMAVAQLDVLEPVELVGRRAQALREQRPAVDPQRELAALGREDGPVGADDVAEVQPDQALERLLAEDVRPGVELDRPERVDEVEERGLAVAAPGGEPAGDPVAVVGLLARRRAPRARRGPPRSRVRPSNSCGNGSTPASRRRSSFSRRSASRCDSERSVSLGLAIGRAESLLRLRSW